MLEFLLRRIDWDPYTRVIGPDIWVPIQEDQVRILIDTPGDVPVHSLTLRDVFFYDSQLCRIRAIRSVTGSLTQTRHVDFNVLWQEITGVARKNPDYIFTCSDQPPYFGWSAFPQIGYGQEYMWSIDIADIKNESDPLINQSLIFNRHAMLEEMLKSVRSEPATLLEDSGSSEGPGSLNKSNFTEALETDLL